MPSEASYDLDMTYIFMYSTNSNEKENGIGISDHNNISRRINKVAERHFAHFFSLINHVSSLCVFVFFLRTTDWDLSLMLCHSVRKHLVMDMEFS